jgi:outer membrane usher protein
MRWAGRSTTVPFYVTSSLLQKGLSDFSVAAGTLRRDYGLKDFSYGTGVTSGSLRYGVSDSFTLESHAEAADSLTLGGIGGNLRLGNFGVLNSAISQSRFEGEGATSSASVISTAASATVFPGNACNAATNTPT